MFRLSFMAGLGFIRWHPTDESSMNRWAYSYPRVIRRSEETAGRWGGSSDMRWHSADPATRARLQFRVDADGLRDNGLRQSICYSPAEHPRHGWGRYGPRDLDCCACVRS